MRISPFLLILSLFSNISFPQWSTNPYENLQVAVHGGNIHIASDENGGAIVTFNNFDDVVKGYMQVIDKYGYLKWNEPKVILDGPGLRNYVWDIFRNLNGTILIGYKSGYTYVDPDPRFEYDPYVQKIDSNGNKLWGENGIRLRADSTGKEISGIDFCYDGDGGLFAFWNFKYETTFPPYFYDSLFIQHISKDGERLWGENGIFVDDSIFSSLDLWIVEDDNNGIYIQYRKRNTEYFIKKFDSSGSLNWTLSVPLNYSRVIKDGYGGIIISGVKDTIGPEQLIINRISPEGEKIWADGIIVDDSVNNNLRYPAVIFLNLDKSTSVFWDTQWFPNDDLFLQRYTLYGAQIWNEHLKVSEFNSPKGTAGIVQSDNNSNIIVWGEIRDSSAMYAQKVDELGNKSWDNNDIMIMSHSPYDESKVITDGNYGAIIVWRIDPPWGGVYAQQISKYGNLGEVITTVIAEDKNINPGSFYLSQNYPNPFNPSTSIVYRIGSREYITLKVYDMLGREVAILVNEEKQEGKYEVEFNGRNLASGIYYYRLTAGSFSETKKLVLLR